MKKNFTEKYSENKGNYPANVQGNNINSEYLRVSRPQNQMSLNRTQYKRGYVNEFQVIPVVPIVNQPQIAVIPNVVLNQGSVRLLNNSHLGACSVHAQCPHCGKNIDTIPSRNCNPITFLIKVIFNLILVLFSTLLSVRLFMLMFIITLYFITIKIRCYWCCSR